MLDTTSLTDRVDRLADWLRAMPQSALRRGAAAEAHDLAQELVRRTQRLEWPSEEPRALPDDGPFVVGDQLAVAGHDLAQVLAEAGGTREQLAEAVRLVEETTAAVGAPVKDPRQRR